jgi:hypothetical protein
MDYYDEDDPFASGYNDPYGEGELVPEGSYQVGYGDGDDGDDDDAGINEYGDEPDLGGGEPEGDDPEFVATFEQTQRAKAAGFEPRAGPGQRALKTPMMLSIEQAQGVLSGTTYQTVGPDLRKRIIEGLEALGPRLNVSNIALMVAAMAWKIDGKPLNPKEFQKFAAKHNMDTPIEQADLLRYIRSVTMTLVR